MVVIPWTITLLSLFMTNQYITINTFYNTPQSNKSAVDPKFKLFLPLDLIQDSHHDKDYFKSISHYPIENAFHKLQYVSSNLHNNYMATPG